jgi:nitroreductase
MQVLQLMKQRCSVRQFEDRPVEQEKLLYVLQAARVAPSACNLQPYQFVVLRDPQTIARICPAWVPASKAPIVIVACGDHQAAWRRRDGKGHANIDVAIAVDHMTLAAAEIGLGTCWICSFDAFHCANVLDLPNHLEPMVLLPIGHPAEGKDPQRHVTERKPLEQLVRRGL